MKASSSWPRWLTGGLRDTVTIQTSRHTIWEARRFSQIPVSALRVRIPFVPVLMPTPVATTPLKMQSNRKAIVSPKPDLLLNP